MFFASHATTLTLANETIASLRREADRQRLLDLAPPLTGRFRGFAGTLGGLLARRATAPVSIARPTTVCCPGNAG